MLLVARSARAAGHFAKAFSGRTARKVYWALIVGVPSAEEGLIDAPLAKQPGTGGEKMHVDEENGLPARTRYRMIDRAGNRAAWVELQPLTGRTHQLRAHMAAIGHPIVGDAKYGGAEAFLTGGISRKLHLHARRLKIDGLDGEPIDDSAELPAHFAESLGMLGFDRMAGDMMPLDNPDPAKPPESRPSASRRRPSRPARRARASGARAAAGAKPAKRPAGASDQAGHFRLRRDTGRQRRDDPRALRADIRCARAGMPAAGGDQEGHRPQPDEAMAALVPEGDHAGADRNLQGSLLRDARRRAGRGAIVRWDRRTARCLEADGWLLGVATGKSDRGLSHCLESHGIGGRFVTLQTADRPPVQAAPGDGAGGDGRGGGGAGADHLRRRHRLGHGLRAKRRRRCDRRRLGLS